MLVVLHRAACLDPPLRYIRAALLASRRVFHSSDATDLDIVPGVPRNSPKFPFVSGTLDISPILFFNFWVLWLLHDKVLPVRSPMSLVVSKSGKGRSYRGHSKNTHFSRFWAPSPIFWHFLPTGCPDQKYTHVLFNNFYALQYISQKEMSFDCQWNGITDSLRHRPFRLSVVHQHRWE